MKEKEPMRLAIYVKPIYDNWVDQLITKNAWSKRFEDGYWIVNMTDPNHGPYDIQISF